MERFKQIVCADIVFTKKEDGITKVLLMKRCNTGSDDGYYELPGGHLEKDEDIYDAMIREIEEELLVKIKRKELKIIHLMHHYNGERLNFIFQSSKKINPKIGEVNKCSELIWVDINNLPELTTKKVKKIIDNINNKKFYDYM